MMNDECRPEAAPETLARESINVPRHLSAMAGRNRRLRQEIDRDRALQNRWTYARAFVAELEHFWGPNGHRQVADGKWQGCCPACRSKGRAPDDWRRYPLAIWEGDGPGRWQIFPACGCLPEWIAKELLAFRRAELDREILALGEAAA